MHIFIKKMIEDIIGLLKEDEVEVFTKSIAGINGYFKNMKEKTKK